MKKIESAFFTFWVHRYRVSFLMAFLILASGIFSLFQIPKESMPDIKFGIISISTFYPGVSPTDMDNLITEKIEKEIEDLDGIKKITSTSGVGISSVVVELENEVNVRDMMTDIRDGLDTLRLPEDAEEPKVQEISTMNELMFQALLYGPEEKVQNFDLNLLAKQIQNDLEGKNGVVSIDIGAGGSDGGVGVSGSSGESYEIQVLLSREKLELLGISISEIAAALQSYNKNTPIGNYAVGEVTYDFRFDGEFVKETDLYNLIIRGNGSSSVSLKDIATFEKKYEKSDESLQKIGFYEKTGYNYISLNFNKKTGANIFSVSESAKKSLEDYIAQRADFSELEIVYVQDLSESIKDDYKQLSNNGLQTLIFVFIIVFLFIGARESFIALALITLSFAITFIALDTLGRSLNFLTNFSLVLSFGIAVDTLTVIIEGAVQKQKLGYSTRNAVLISIKELKSSLITGTFATLFAFLPMIFLPGIIGKFLSYIPITTFFMLGAALFVSLTLAAAFFIKLSKDFSFYFSDRFQEDILDEDERKILETDRAGKKSSQASQESKRLEFLGKVTDTYFRTISIFIHRKLLRLIGVFGPVIFLFLTFFVLSPQIGFVIFPQSDEGQINISLEAKQGTRTQTLGNYLENIDEELSTYPEIKTFASKAQGNTISVSIELFPLTERKKQDQRSVFDIETLILDDFQYFESQGLKVAVQSQGGGPPTSKPVGIKLIVEDNRNVETLRQVAADFEKYLKEQSGLKNISLSSKDSPGQFVFRFNQERLSLSGLGPQDLIGGIYTAINGMKVGTIKSDLEDNDIVLKIADFKDELTPQDIENLSIQTKVGKIRVGDYVSYSFEKSLSSIARENGNISITVDADTLPGKVGTDYQPALIAFAQTYNFPDGVSYAAGGEGEENKELVVSTVKSFFIALFLIFGILVLQFNSYSQPLMILYSAILAIGGVNVGLFLTGNPYSMPFAIGFISLLGILINNSIILIETINSNLKKILTLKGKMTQEEYMNSIISAGTSRFQAIIITLVINLVGVLPIAFQDAFWAGIGFTIVFGLLAGTFLTLFSLPSLYYMLYYRRYVKK